MRFYRATIELNGQNGAQVVSTWLKQRAAAISWVKSEKADAEKGGQTVTGGFVDQCEVGLFRENVLRMLNRTPITANVVRVWELESGRVSATQEVEL